MSKKAFSRHWIYMLVLYSSKRLSSLGSSSIPTSGFTSLGIRFSLTGPAPKTCVIPSSGAFRVPTSGFSPQELGFLLPKLTSHPHQGSLRFPRLGLLPRNSLALSSQPKTFQMHFNFQHVLHQNSQRIITMPFSFSRRLKCLNKIKLTYDKHITTHFKKVCLQAS